MDEWPSYLGVSHHYDKPTNPVVKFFRKIRYDLLEKNKTGKYLKYAVGEIILVVIGILIALSINNWNGNRKLNNMAEDVYENLLTSLEQDSIEVEKIIKFVSLWMSTELLGFKVVFCLRYCYLTPNVKNFPSLVSFDQMSNNIGGECTSSMCSWGFLPPSV